MSNPNYPGSNEELAQPKNLSVDQLESLEKQGLKVIKEYPKVIFGQGDEEDISFIKTDAALKPIVGIVRQGSGAESEITISEALDSLSVGNKYRTALDEHKIQFTRSLISLNRKGEVKPRTLRDFFRLETDEQAELESNFITELTHHGFEYFGSRPGGVKCKDSRVQIANIRPDFVDRMRLFAALENACVFLEHHIEPSHGPLSKTEQLYNDEFNKLTQDPKALKEILESNYIPEFVQSLGISWEEFCRKLIQYHNDYFPKTYEERAKLKDEINAWIKSLKPENP